MFISYSDDSERTDTPTQVNVLGRYCQEAPPGIKTRPDTSICDFITMKLLLSKLKLLILLVERENLFSLLLLLLLYLLYLLLTEILDMSEFQQQKKNSNHTLNYADFGFHRRFWIFSDMCDFLEIDFTGAVNSTNLTFLF